MRLEIVTASLVALSLGLRPTPQDPVASRPARPRLAALVGICVPHTSAAVNDAVLMHEALQRRGFEDPSILDSLVFGPKGRAALLGFFERVRIQIADWSEGDLVLLVAGDGVLGKFEDGRPRPGVEIEWHEGGGLEAVYWDEIWDTLNVPSNVQLFVVADHSHSDKLKDHLPVHANALLLDGERVEPRDMVARRRTFDSGRRGLFRGEQGVLSYFAARSLMTATDASSWFEATREGVARAALREGETIAIQCVGDPTATFPGESMVARLGRSLEAASRCVEDPLGAADLASNLAEAGKQISFMGDSTPARLLRERERVLALRARARLASSLHSADQLPAKTQSELIAIDKILTAANNDLPDCVRDRFPIGIPGAEDVVSTIRTLRERLADLRETWSRMDAPMLEATRRLESKTPIDLLDAKWFRPDATADSMHWTNADDVEMRRDGTSLRLRRRPTSRESLIASARSGAPAALASTEEFASASLVWRFGGASSPADFDVRFVFRLERGRFGFVARTSLPPSIGDRFGIGNLPPGTLRGCVRCLGDPFFSPRYGSRWEARITVVGTTEVITFRSLEGDEVFDPIASSVPSMGEFVFDLSPDSELVIESMQMRLAP